MTHRDENWMRDGHPSLGWDARPPVDPAEDERRDQRSGMVANLLKPLAAVRSWARGWGSRSDTKPRDNPNWMRDDYPWR